MGKLYKFVGDDVKGIGWKSVLDVGTGPGDIPILLSKSFKSRGIYAVDPSGPMINISKRRSKGLGIHFALGSSRSVPFKRKFDLIISTLSFHHWGERERSLRYLAGFLSKNGQIRIYEFERRELRGISRYFASAHSAAKEEMVSIARVSGLKIAGILQKDGYIRISMKR